MAYTPIPKGEQNWDVPVNDAFTSQDLRITGTENVNAAQTASINTLNSTVAATFTARQSNLHFWTMDPATLPGQSGMQAGVLHMSRLNLYEAASIDTIYINVQSAGSGLTAGQNLVGLYDQAGTLLSSSADQTTAWGTTGLKVTSIAPVSLVAGAYYLGKLANGTTPPQLSRGSGSVTLNAAMNIGYTMETARFANSGSSLTALPASVTMSARTLGPTGWWVAF
jgi:hypothetical protein